MATRVVEGKKPYTGGKAISIDENKVISLNLRDENNLIIYDAGDDEIYVDLQLDDEITPTSAFPIGVNVGRVIVDNGWDKPGTIISAETTSGDNIKIFYADEGTLWIDNGTGTFKQIYFKSDVDALLLALRNYIDGELAKKQNGVSSDTAPENPSEGDLWYDTTSNAMNVWDGTAWQSVGTGGGGSDIVYATQAEYNALLPGAASDGKHYFIYTSSTPSGWDMNNRALAQTSSALSGQWWGGVYFNPNGDKIYLTNVMEKKIYESDLDSPYDISNISFNKYISISIGPEDIHFSTDGTKMFTVSEVSSNCTVWQYDLSTAWDISSATLNNNTISGLSGYCRGLYISPDGLNVYVTIRNSNTFYKIPLATAWDISSAGATISGSSTVGGLSLWIGNNGTFAAGGGDETESIIRYGTLTTPYDLNSVTGVDTKEVGQARAGGMWFNNEGTICVIVGGGSSTNYVTKYTL